MSLKTSSFKLIESRQPLYSDADIKNRIERDSQLLHQIRCDIDEHLLEDNMTQFPSFTNSSLTQRKPTQLLFDSFASHNTVDHIIQRANNIDYRKPKISIDESEEMNENEAIIDEEMYITGDASKEESNRMDNNSVSTGAKHFTTIPTTESEGK